MTAVLLALALILPPLEPPPLAELSTTATASATAVRLDPPPPTVPTFADDCDEMSYYRAGVGLPAVFDRLGWRESNCRNEDGVRTSCCHGWWQLSINLFLRDARMSRRLADCGVTSAADVNSDTAADKLRQACAARALYDLEGLAPWSTS